MKWEIIKKSIVDDLQSRGLKDPGRRMSALEKIEALMRQYFPEYIESPEELKYVEKETFKYMLAKKKGYVLNGAEKSIVNEIYYRLFPPQQSPAHSDSYRMCVCPYCSENSIITADLYDSETFICPICANTFINPYLASIDPFYESSSIEEIINTIDDEIIKTGEEYLLIGQTNMLLLSANIFSMTEISNKVLRNLLENNKIPHAYQTDAEPNEWRIPLSEEGKVRKKYQREIIPAKPTTGSYQMKQTQNENTYTTTKGRTLNKRKRNWLIAFAVVIGFIILIVKPYLPMQDKRQPIGISTTENFEIRSDSSISPPEPENYKAVRIDSSISQPKPTNKIEQTRTPSRTTPKIEQENFEILGTWADDFNKGVLWRILKSKNERYVLEIGHTQSREWRRSSGLVKTQKNRSMVYEDRESGRDEYYKIESNGNLSVYDDLGYVATYKKFNN